MTDNVDLIQNHGQKWWGPLIVLMWWKNQISRDDATMRLTRKNYSHNLWNFVWVLIARYFSKRIRVWLLLVLARSHTLLFFHSKDNCNHSTTMLDYRRYILYTLQSPHSICLTSHNILFATKLIKHVIRFLKISFIFHPMPNKCSIFLWSLIYNLESYEFLTPSHSGLGML